MTEGAEVESGVSDGMARYGTGGRSSSEAIDAFLVRVLPWLIAACVATTIVLAVIRHIGDFWNFLSQTCTVFALAFAIVGGIASLRLSKGSYPFWMVASFGMAALAIMWLCLTDSETVLFLRGIYSLAPVGEEEGAGFYLLDVLLSMVLMLFASVGVIATVSAMLGKYMPKLLVSVEFGNGDKRSAAKFFMVPDVLDVERVELDPREDRGDFDVESFLMLAFYTFALGLLVGTMLFLNPVILETVPDHVLIRVMVLISLFLPAMVVPWQAVKDVGAKVISSAPRPYYLWTGAKRRLFTGFMALGLFFFSFVIAVYYGNSVETMLSYYVQYLVPLATVSMIYGFIYANCFAAGLSDNIREEFTVRRERSLRKRGLL
ncbi:MAG: hypothetical protein J5674_00060 [Candidatus Methanomethylophilaceae archaeon]|nr:hypothetical protein [Candidatus Methanomethylophilaceae archaeon]